MSDIREDLEAAFEQHAEPTPEPVAEQPPETAQEPAASLEPKPEEPTAAATARARDEAGRFAKKAADTASVKAGEVAPQNPPAEVTPPAPPEPPKETFKAPQSWKPTAREAFNRLPAEVQAALGPEFVRREQEIARTMQETAEARKFREEFRETFRPFEPFMAAAGRAPLESLRNLAQTAAALQTAPPAHKAQIIAQMIHGYGVPVDQLDAILAGQQPQQMQQQIDPRQIAAQVRQSIMQEFQAKKEQAIQTKVASDVEAFKANHEFFDDVRDDMADLIAAKAQRGVALSIDEAYNLAVSMNPEIRRVHEQRKAAEAAKAQVASTQRAKAAGSSIKAIPVESVRKPGPQSLRETIEASFAAQR